MSVEIKKDITTVTVEVPKTGVAIENAITNINVQVSQPQLTISQAGVSGRNGTSGTSGTFGNVLSSSLRISGSIIPNVADGDLTSSFSLGSATNAWKDLWISKGTIYFIGDNNQTASISINTNNQIEINQIDLNSGSFSYLKLKTTGSKQMVFNEGTILFENIDGPNYGEIEVTENQFRIWAGSLQEGIINPLVLYGDTLSLRGDNGIIIVGAIQSPANEGNIFINDELIVSSSFTASLVEGYTWVGGIGNVTKLVATSSFGGGIATLPNGVISGSQQIYDLGFIGTSQAIVDTGSFAITGSNIFSGSQYIISGGLVFNNGVQLYEDDSDLYIQSLSEIRVRANGNNYKFGNDGNFYTSVGGVVFTHDGLINQIPGASGDNINIVVGINDSIVLTTDAGDGDYAWDFDNNGDLTVPGNIYGATNLATNGGNIFNGNQIIAGTLLVSGSSDFDGGISITGSLNVSGSDSTIILPNHSTAPSTPSSGALYFNTTNFHFYGWDGGQWKQLDN